MTTARFLFSSVTGTCLLLATLLGTLFQPGEALGADLCLTFTDGYALSSDADAYCDGVDKVQLGEGCGSSLLAWRFDTNRSQKVEGNADIRKVWFDFSDQPVSPFGMEPLRKSGVDTRFLFNCGSGVNVCEMANGEEKFVDLTIKFVDDTDNIWDLRFVIDENTCGVGAALGGAKVTKISESEWTLSSGTAQDTQAPNAHLFNRGTGQEVGEGVFMPFEMTITGLPASGVCGDGTCDPGEDPSTCPADCQVPPCDLGQKGDPCSSDAECCSNNCRGGRCKGDGTAGTLIEAPFLRGDSNADGAVDLADPIHTLNYLFLGGPTPSCSDAADSDDNGRLEITDAVFALEWLFLGVGAMPPPGPDVCGPDVTEDALADCAYDPVNC